MKTININGLVAIFVGLVISFPIASYSQEEEEKPLELEEMVITGTKTEKLLIDVPVRTEIITGAEIEAKGAVNLYEALDGMPGIATVFLLQLQRRENAGTGVRTCSGIDRRSAYLFRLSRRIWLAADTCL